MKRPKEWTTSRRIVCVQEKPARRPCLLMLAGPEIGRLQLLDDGGELVVGRDGSCDWSLCDESVSRRHASFAVRDGLPMVRDLGSKNGTFIDGERIAGECVLAVGDKIQMGDVTLRYWIADAADQEFQRRMVEAALIDPLTGLHNRRYFDERLQAEVAAARRRHDPLSLVLLDIYHFMPTNRSSGLPAGHATSKTAAD